MKRCDTAAHCGRSNNDSDSKGRGRQPPSARADPWGQAPLAYVTLQILPIGIIGQVQRSIRTTARPHRSVGASVRFTGGPGRQHPLHILKAAPAGLRTIRRRTRRPRRPAVAPYRGRGTRHEQLRRAILRPNVEQLSNVVPSGGQCGNGHLLCARHVASFPAVTAVVRPKINARQPHAVCRTARHQ
jgi:hypothetical protein